jgi:hypothetical protein
MWLNNNAQNALLCFNCKKWLRKRATMLRYAYIAYFVNSEFIESFVTPYVRGLYISGTTTTFSDFYCSCCAETGLIVCAVMLTYG